MTVSARTAIVGIHGIGNFQAGLTPSEGATRLSEWWRSYVRLRGSAGLEVFYYADKLRRANAQSSAGVVSDSVLVEIAAWTRELGYGRMVPEGRLTAPLRSMTSWIARKYGLDQKLTENFVARFFTEMHDYFALAHKRRDIQIDFLRLVSTCKPRIIIAHSLGSVVAYEALHRADSNASIELLLTLGSPLAIPGIVLDKLDDSAFRRGRPGCVSKWINIADVGDIVAVPSGGISECFADVDWDLSDRIHSFDFHRVEHYLKCGVVRGVLASHL